MVNVKNAKATDVVYSNTALATVFTSDGRNFVVEIPFNFETGQVGELKKLAKPNRDEAVEEYRILSARLGLV